MLMPTARTASRLNAAPVAVRVFIPWPLRHECGGRTELELAATNPRDLLAQLEQLHPRLHRGICNETGSLRQHINLFVNHDHMRELQGLDTAFTPGDTITIMTAVSGG